MSEFKFELDDTKRLANRAERFIEVFSRTSKEISRKENLDFTAIQKIYLEAFGDAFDSPCVLLLKKVSEDRVEVIETKESDGVEIKKGEQLREEGFIRAVFEKEKDYMSKRCLEESDPLAQKGISSCCAICYQYRGERWLMLLCNWPVDKKAGDAIDSYGAKLAEIAMNLLVIIADVEYRNAQEIKDHANEIEKANEELRKAQAELIQAERLAVTGTLLFTVAHQLKNPLNNLSLSMYSLNRLLPDKSPEVEERVKNIEMEIDRSSKIIKNFLGFARPSKGARKEENINLILTQTLNLLKDSALFKDIKIETRFNPLLPKVIVDPDQMKEVFLNIVLNTQEAMSKGGVLTVTTDIICDEKEGISVTFSDTGCGISPENIKDIFNPFYTTKQKGMGLGLSIAQRIIQEYGGTIGVESVVEKGATFNIRLPIKKEE